jgi:hypothetical protein
MVPDAGLNSAKATFPLFNHAFRSDALRVFDGEDLVTIGDDRDGTVVRAHVAGGVDGTNRFAWNHGRIPFLVVTVYTLPRTY